MKTTLMKDIFCLTHKFFLCLWLKMINKVVVWNIPGSSWVFLGISHVYRRLDVIKLLFIFLIFIFFYYREYLGQEPRRVEGKLFFLPCKANSFFFPPEEKLEPREVKLQSQFSLRWSIFKTGCKLHHINQLYIVYMVVQSADVD